MRKFETVYRWNRKTLFFDSYTNGRRSVGCHFTNESLTFSESSIRFFRIRDRHWLTMEYYERFDPPYYEPYWGDDWTPEEENERYWQQERV